MVDPNITMEEYIRLEEEKARRRGQVYNWDTAMYDKIWCNKDVHGLRFIETEFPAIVLNDALTSEVALLCEPTISPLNDNQVNFRISFDESEDEDYTPTISYFNDLDDFKDFEKEFPAIVYNDASMSKLDFLTEPTVCPQHIDKFDLKDETSLFECDEEERNVLYFSESISFQRFSSLIYPARLCCCIHRYADLVNEVVELLYPFFCIESVFSSSFSAILMWIFLLEIRRKHLYGYSINDASSFIVLERANGTPFLSMHVFFWCHGSSLIDHWLCDMSFSTCLHSHNSLVSEEFNHRMDGSAYRSEASHFGPAYYDVIQKPISGALHLLSLDWMLTLTFLKQCSYMISNELSPSTRILRA
nr:hypothetical protein [Tanacetum cinerariifolium]